jgi:hypothetical protein
MKAGWLTGSQPAFIVRAFLGRTVPARRLFTPSARAYGSQGWGSNPFGRAQVKGYFV